MIKKIKKLMATLTSALMSFLSIKEKNINKLDVINKCRVLRLNIAQMDYDLNANVISEEEYKKKYKILDREISKLEKKFL